MERTSSKSAGRTYSEFSKKDNEEPEPQEQDGNEPTKKRRIVDLPTLKNNKLKHNLVRLGDSTSQFKENLNDLLLSFQEFLGKSEENHDSIRKYLFSCVTDLPHKARVFSLLCAALDDTEAEECSKFLDSFFDKFESFQKCYNSLHPNQKLLNFSQIQFHRIFSENHLCL